MLPSPYREAIFYGGLNSSNKLLWIKLYLMYGYDYFSGSYEEMAKEVNSKRYTVRAQIWLLKEVGAIETEDYYYSDGQRGQAGQTFRLIDPKGWKNA